MGWAGWPLQRAVLLLTAILFLGIFAQVAMYHSRQNFRFPSQWIPVVGTPLLGLATLAFTATRAPGLEALLPAMYWAGVGTGLYGGAVHFVGVGQRVNGYTGYNFLVGPPVVLPLLISLVSLLGLLALGRLGAP